jgi:hypothetical protein
MRYIEWVDSTSECGSAWLDRAEAVEGLSTMPEADMICKTCGFVLFENDHIVAITSCYHASECGPYVTIPVECIRYSATLRILE